MSDMDDMHAWSQADLDEYVRQISQPNPPSEPVDLRAEIEQFLSEPHWLRMMDPRDREWLDRVNGGRGLMFGHPECAECQDREEWRP